jgi:glycosyltransferase involved in cell wall biosynthesis
LKTEEKNARMTLFTVVVPMKNAAPFVQMALRSVLEQAVDLEVVVVDDGSTDKSVDLVNELGDARVRIVPGPQRGIAAALNAGLEAAQGEIIARCDADDLFATGRLEWQKEWLEAHPDFGAVCGAYAAMDSKGRLLTMFGKNAAALEITDDLRGGTTRTSFCTYAVRAEHLRQVGGFRSYFATAEDLDLQYRLGEVCRVWWEPQPCYWYRLHERSTTHTQADALRRFYEVVAKEFSRQRQVSGMDDLARGCPPSPPKTCGDHPALLREQIHGFLNSRAWTACREGRRMEALVLGSRALVARPERLASWVNLVKLGARCLLPGAPEKE